MNAEWSQTLTATRSGEFRGEYAAWKEWDAEQFGRYSPLDAAYFAAELDIRVPPQERVLEIGFGNGSALGWLKGLGADVYAVEANPILVERARRLLGEKKAFLDLEDAGLASLAGTFTLVVAFDVIEHIPLTALPQVFSSLRGLLAPGGRCVLRFPNGDSPFGRVHQHGDPTHVTTLGSARVDYLARSAGLEIDAMRAPALPLKGIGLRRSLRRRLILAGRALIERCIGLLYFGGQRIPLDPNYTAVLRRPPT